MKINIALILAFVSMILSGCKTPPPVNTSANVVEQETINQIADKSIETDSNLTQGLTMTEVRESQTNDGYMRIQGCKTPPTVNTIANAIEQATVNRIADKRIETDSNLAQGLMVTEVRESQTNDGYVRIQVYFKNLSTGTYKIMYRFNWYDNNGVEVNNPDNELWTKKLILGGDDMVLTSVAPKKVCHDFKLRLKEIL